RAPPQSRGAGIRRTPDLLRRSNPARARSTRDLAGPLQAQVPRANSPQYAARGGAEPQEDDLRIRACVARRKRLRPLVRLGAGHHVARRRHASPRARRSGCRLARGHRGSMKEDKLMAHDPLSDADAILSEEYYGRRARTDDAAASAGRRRAAPGVKPTHYKVICISMYTRDIE